MFGFLLQPQGEKSPFDKISFFVDRKWKFQFLTTLKSDQKMTVAFCVNRNINFFGVLSNDFTQKLSFVFRPSKQKKKKLIFCWSFPEKNTFIAHRKFKTSSFSWLSCILIISGLLGRGQTQKKCFYLRHRVALQLKKKELGVKVDFRKID